MCSYRRRPSFVLEGVVYRDRRHAEGPFVDLTETYDVVRQEPVFRSKDHHVPQGRHLAGRCCPARWNTSC